MKKITLTLVIVISLFVPFSGIAQYGIGLQIASDKEQYYLNETIELTITATNSSTYPVSLEFPTGCQCLYLFDGTEYINGQSPICLQFISGLTIPANSSLEWIHLHNLATEPALPGSHWIVGMLDVMWDPIYSNGIEIEVNGEYYIKEFTEETFENYSTWGSFVTQAWGDGNSYWTTWNNNPGSNEDPFVSNLQASTGLKSLLIESNNDPVLLLGDKTSGHYTLEFDLMVDEGYRGYFNLLQHFDEVDSEWGAQVFFDTLGEGSVWAGSTSAEIFQYQYNQWMHFLCYINLDEDSAAIILDNIELVSWQWSTGLNGQNSVKKLAAINFYGWNDCGPSRYFVDDILFHELPGTSTHQLGSSANIYSIEENWLNQIVVDNNLNTVAFIHRNNPNEFGGHTGQLRYDLSTDGGENWQINQGLLNPTSDTNTSARHPQLSLYNPPENTNPENASLIYYSPYTDGNGGITGNVSGAYKLDGSASTENYNQAAINNPYIPGGLIKSENDVFWMVDKKNPYNKLRIIKGIWGSNDVVWQVVDSIQLMDYWIYSWSISFAPDGNIGWLAAYCKKFMDNKYGYYFKLVLYKTDDGGNSWDGPYDLDFNAIPEITEQIPEPYCASGIVNGDFDISVDLFGNPHVLIDVFAKEPDQNTVHNEIFHKLYAFDFIENNWIINEIASLETYWYSLYTDNYWYLFNRLHICKSEEANSLFYMWTDSDSTQTTDNQNSKPNLFGIGYYVETGEWTEINSFTEGTYLDGEIFASTVSPIALQEENQLKVPVVYAKLSDSGLPTDPVDYYYLDGVNFNAGVCPEVYAGEDITICENQIIQLSDATAQNVSGATWTTSGDGIFEDNTLINPTYIPGANDLLNELAQLHIEGFPISPCQISDIDTITISFQPTPVVFVGEDATICEGEDIVFTASSINSSNCYWQTSGDGIFSDYGNLYTSYSPSPNDVENGFIEICIICEPINPCNQQATDCLTLSIDPQPIPTFCFNGVEATSGAVLNFCETETVIIDLCAVYAGIAPFEVCYDILFNGAPIVIDECQTVNLGDQLWNDLVSPGQYVVTVTSVTDANGCVFADPALYTVTVNIQPEPTVDAGADMITCEETPIMFTGTATDYSSVMWSGGLGSFDPANTLATEYTPATGEFGEVTLILTAEPIIPCMVAYSDDMALFIQEGPDADAGPDLVLCDNVQIIPLDGIWLNGQSVEWTHDGQGFIDDPSNCVTFYTPFGNDIANGVTFTLTAYGINPPCPDFDQDDFTVTFDPSPIADAGPDMTICEGEDIVLMPSSTNSGNCYWISSGGGIFFDIGNFTTTYSPSPNDVGLVELCLICEPINSCLVAAMDCMTLTIIAKPSVFTWEDAQICETDFHSVSGVAENISATIWDTSGDGLFANPEDLITEYFPGPEDVQSGTVTLTITAYPISPCTETISDSQVLTFTPQPFVYAGSNITTCNEANLFGIAGNYESIIWTTSGDGTFSETGSLTSIYFPGEGDILTSPVVLTLTAIPNSPCSVEKTDDILLFLDYPQIVFDGVQDKQLAVGEELYLFLGVESISPGEYTWFKDEELIQGENNIDLVISEVVSENAGVYQCYYNNECGETISNLADVTIVETASQEIILPMGWSGISTYLNPNTPELATLLAPIADELIFLSDNEGVYWPAQNINSIGDWDMTHGYIIKMDAETSIVVDGFVEHPSQTTIIPAGWSILPVNSKNNTEVNLLLGNTPVTIVKEVAGPRIYWPSLGINSLEELKPGNAYYILMESEYELSYPGWKCGNLLVDYRNGQSYATVQIGGQCWMAENLNFGERIDGVEDMADNSIYEKYCYENDSTNCKIFGGLYQWDEMMQYDTIGGMQGICPEGWTLPTDNEFLLLMNTLGGESIAGGKLKATGTVQAGDGLWNEPNTGATNESGFNGLPGGTRSSDGNFYSKNVITYYWSSSMSSPLSSWTNRLANSNTWFKHDPVGRSALGFALRCINNSAILNNQQPTKPSSPQPYNNSINNPLEPILSWSCSDPDNDPILYDVYFGGEQNLLKVATGTPDTFYLPIDLDYSSTYYWKIVAHDDHNFTTEGDVWSFTTIQDPDWTCGDTLTDIRDGQTYTSVQIGEQCWMAENLNFGNKITLHDPSTNNSIVEKYCYEDLDVTCDIYGGLYDWNEVMEYTTEEGTKGICPDGWHIPTEGEFDYLCYFLGGKPLAGGKLKESGYDHWSLPNTGATNQSGFTGLPAGYRAYYYTTGYSYGQLSYSSYYWSSSHAQTENTDPIILSLQYNHQSLGLGQSSQGSLFISVRCILNSE